MTTPAASTPAESDFTRASVSCLSLWRALPLLDQRRSIVENRRRFSREVMRFRSLEELRLTTPCSCKAEGVQLIAREERHISRH